MVFKNPVTKYIKIGPGVEILLAPLVVPVCDRPSPGEAGGREMVAAGNPVSVASNKEPVFNGSEAGCLLGYAVCLEK